jgi:hypothetical protein
MSDEPIEGQIIEPEQEEDNTPVDFWNAFDLPPKPFGELLRNIRLRIGQELGRAVTQEEFGRMLGDVNQVTVGRWQRGDQRPQKAQLEKIVALAGQYGMAGVTLERLQKSLSMDIEEYSSLDPRLRRLDALLNTEEESFKAGFYEIAIAIVYILRGVTRS